MKNQSTPVLLRQARKAISAQDYEQAALIYTVLMNHEEMDGNFDIRIRHAYCVHKTGHTSQAIALYKGIVNHYHTVGETGAAEAVEKTIEELEAAIREQRAAARAESERLKTEAQAEIRRLREQKEREERLRVEREIEELIRSEKEQQEELRVEKERQEQKARELIAREQKERAALLRKKKAEAEQLRSARFHAKKGTLLPSSEANTLGTGSFEVTLTGQINDGEEIPTFDISDGEESEFDKPEEPWLG